MSGNTIKVMDALSYKFPIIWDRFTYDDDTDFYSIYGWINREGKERDFILVTMYSTDLLEDIWFATSSVKYSAKIAEIVSGNTDNHLPCKKIAELL